MENLWNPNPMTEELLLAKGEKWRKWGIRLISISLCGLLLFILTLLTTVLFFSVLDVLYILTLRTNIFIAKLFAFIGYLSIPCLIVAVVLYIKGLHFWALGKIALHTKNNIQK